MKQYSTEQKQTLAELLHKHRNAFGKSDWEAMSADPEFTRVGLHKRSRGALTVMASKLDRHGTCAGNGTADPIARLMDLENQTKIALAELHRKKQELEHEQRKIDELLARYESTIP